MLSLLALAPAFSAVTTEFAQPALPATWRHVAPADFDAVVPVLVSLRPRNLAELHRIASAVSDPRHPKYGEFLALAEVNELTAPSPSDLAAVAAWLAPAAVGASETLPSGAVRARLHATAAAGGAAAHELHRDRGGRLGPPPRARRRVHAAGADRRRRRGDLRPPPGSRCRRRGSTSARRRAAGCSRARRRARCRRWCR